MKTNNFNELDILALLHSKEFFSSEELYASVPGVRQGGQPAMTFAKQLRQLLLRGQIKTMTDHRGNRFWWVLKP